MSEETDLRILFIDDDQQAGVVAQDLSGRLAESGVPTVVKHAGTLDRGLKLLEAEQFDVAVVDLRLGDEASGNEIIRRIIDTKIIPVIVYSGYPQDLGEEYDNHGLIFKSPKKRVEHVATKVLEWRQKGILDFFSERGVVARSLRQSMQRTMWEHLSRYWEFFQGADAAMLPQVAGRIAATLFHDFLSTSNEAGAEIGEVAIHHGEIYVFKTPRRFLAVGDVIRDGQERYVVLTPACDLVLRKGVAKAEKVLVAQCRSLLDFAGTSTEVSTIFRNLRHNSESKRKDAISKVEKMMRHAVANEDGRLFFLPPFGGFEGGVIDFLRLSTLPYSGDSIEALVGQRIISLNREVASELAARFGRYMIRLGQPAYHAATLISSMEESLREFVASPAPENNPVEARKKPKGES